jgi:hypothetical protein
MNNDSGPVHEACVNADLCICSVMLSVNVCDTFAGFVAEGLWGQSLVYSLSLHLWNNIILQLSAMLAHLPNVEYLNIFHASGSHFHPVNIPLGCGSTAFAWACCWKHADLKPHQCGGIDFHPFAMWFSLYIILYPYILHPSTNHLSPAYDLLHETRVVHED